MTFDGMLRELEALESLKVGDVVWERGNKKVITRWVCSAKNRGAWRAKRDTLQGGGQGLCAAVQ